MSLYDVKKGGQVAGKGDGSTKPSPFPQAWKKDGSPDSISLHNLKAAANPRRPSEAWRRIRIRLMPQNAAKFRELKPIARARAVALILNAQAEGIDLGELLRMRQLLVNLGTLLNQSLRTSWGQQTDSKAAAEVVGLLRRLVQ